MQLKEELGHHQRAPDLSMDEDVSELCMELLLPHFAFVVEPPFPDHGSNQPASFSWKAGMPDGSAADLKGAGATVETSDSFVALVFLTSVPNPPLSHPSCSCPKSLKFIFEFGGVDEDLENWYYT